MKLVDGNLYFKNISKNDSQYSYLNKNISCDVLIIGAGVSGAITAYYMAEEGYDVAIIDKNIVGYGSTSANIGIIGTQFACEISKLSKQIGEKKARKCYNLMLSSINEISKIVSKLNSKENIDFKRVNSLCYTDKYMNKNAIIKEYNSKINCKIDAKFVNENSMINLKYGIEEQNRSAVINAYEFTKEILSYLSDKNNVRIYENTKSYEIKSSEDGAIVTTNNNFKISASKVIITEGTEAINDLCDIPIDIYKSYNIVTEKINDLEKYNTNFVAKSSDIPFNYFRFTKDNRIVFGGQISKVTEKDTNKEISKQLSNTRYRKLFKELQETFFDFKDITVRYCFNGMFAETKDSLPIIDEIPGMPNVYCNLSYGISGIMFAIIGAKMLKEINREYYARDMYMFGIKR